LTFSHLAFIAATNNQFRRHRYLYNILFDATKSRIVHGDEFVSGNLRGNMIAHHEFEKQCQLSKKHWTTLYPHNASGVSVHSHQCSLQPPMGAEEFHRVSSASAGFCQGAL